MTSVDAAGGFLYGPVGDATRKAIAGYSVCLYVRSFRRASARTSEARKYLERIGIPYELRKNSVRFPSTGGSLNFAVTEPELRGYHEECLYMDTIG